MTSVVCHRSLHSQCQWFAKTHILLIIARSYTKVDQLRLASLKNCLGKKILSKNAVKARHISFCEAKEVGQEELGRSSP